MSQIRFAVRRLAWSPGFLFAAIATLALGIAATTLVFSAVHGLLVRPLPFSDAERLAWILAKPAAGTELEGVSSDEARALAARVPALESVAVIGDRGLVREIGRRHDRWRGIWTTRALATVLDVRLAAGSIPSRVTGDGLRPLLVAYERWQSDFGGDVSLIGRELHFADNKRFVVAGILPRGLEFPFARAPHRGNGAGFVAGRQDFWILEADADGLPGGIAIARVRPGQLTEAKAQLATVSDSRSRIVTLLPMRDQVLGGLAPALVLVQIFAIVVLLVACGNLATLLLARALAQRGEVAIRIALGAGSRALIGMFTAEAFVISACGALLGLALAGAGRSLLILLAPRHEALVARVTIDWTVALVAAGLCALTTLLFGVIPGSLRARAAVSGTPDNSARHTSHALPASLRVLVVVQVSLSLALLVGAAALHQSFQQVMRVDTGYDMRGVVAADILLFIPAKEALPLIDGLVTRLQASPAIAAVGLIHSTPLTGKWTIRDAMEVVDGPRRGDTGAMSGGFVGYDYFAAMGIPVLAGRTFTKSEFTNSRQRVMIVNDVAARAFFPGGEAVGARVKMNDRIYEIVGVVKGTRDVRLDTPAEPQWYQPAVLGSSQVIVRGMQNDAETLAELRRALDATDPRLIVERIDVFDTVAADSVIERRLAARIVSAFAVVAIALSGFGLYGVLQFATARRQREFGIRAAVGATPSSLLRLVLRQGLALAAIGIAAGLALTLAAADVLRSMLFETSPLDVSSLIGAVAAILVVAATASLRPAWKAATVDPVLSLRA